MNKNSYAKFGAMIAQREEITEMRSLLDDLGTPK